MLPIIMAKKWLTTVIILLSQLTAANWKAHNENAKLALSPYCSCFSAIFFNMNDRDVMGTTV